jgi:predicted nucleic acid-binding protein
MPEIVFDSCIVSNFALSGALPVLEKLYRGGAIITDFVAAEVLRGIQAGHTALAGIPEAVRAGWMKETGLCSSKEKALFSALSISLGLGEASSIAVAECRGFRLASDDRVARAEAGRLAVLLTGTVGILVKAVRSGVCNTGTADVHLDKMIAAGFFSPVQSIQNIV